MFVNVSDFVRSCNACQFRSKSRPIMSYNPSWTVAVLRKFHIDTVYMPKGRRGMRYLLQAMEPAIGWPEARAAKRNTSKAWAKFIYTDIICRFSCIPVFVCDNGPEFKGAVKYLFDKYNIICVLVAPYHPEANGVAERAHPTLVNSILKASGTNASDWPLYLHGALLAMRTTTSRMTGYTPYYLLYGQNPVFGFDVADRTWSALDWYAVKDTADLLALRLKQITRREVDIGRAMDRVNENRKKAVEAHERKYAGKIQKEMWPIGTLVLVHQTWLDNQHGHKGALRWAGPYVVRRVIDRFYELMELDGTIMKGAFAADRIKKFFYRYEKQSMTDLPMHRERLAPAAADRSSRVVEAVSELKNENARIFGSLREDLPCWRIGDIAREESVLVDNNELVTVMASNLDDLCNMAPSRHPWW